MKASLDTDIVIHLYSSEKKELFFKSFEELYMHEYLYEEELKRKSLTTFKAFSSDVEEGKISIIKNKDLIEMEIKGLFEGYKRDYQYLFDSGELYSVCLAKSMGLFAFVSDDTKEFGPHETLVKELIKDVMPFSFYELLFLEFLAGDLTAVQMHKEFEIVTSRSMSKFPMKFKSRMFTTVRRFSSKNGTERDYEWIQDYCRKKSISYNVKMMELKAYLSTI